MSFITHHSHTIFSQFAACGGTNLVRHDLEPQNTFSRRTQGGKFGSSSTRSFGFNRSWQFQATKAFRLTYYTRDSATQEIRGCGSAQPDQQTFLDTNLSTTILRIVMLVRRARHAATLSLSALRRSLRCSASASRAISAGPSQNQWRDTLTC